MDKLDRQELLGQYRSLWESVFDDGEEFVNLYFNRRCTPENTVSVFENGHVVSAMQSFQYDMTFCNATVHIGYVSGLATLPAFRNRGLAAKVLRESHSRLYDHGALFSLLIPAESSLFDYYGRMNYVACSYFSEETKKCSGLLNANKSNKYVPTPQLTQNVIDFVQREMQKRPCCIQHSKKDVEDIYQVMKIENGSFPLLLDKDEIVAIAVTEFVEGALRVNDIFGPEKYRTELLDDIAETEKSTTMLVRDFTKRSKPYGMARIINVKDFVRLVAQANPDMEYTFSVVDDEIAGNNGTFSVRNGTCQYTALCSACHQALTISELADMMLPRFNPVMSLMLD